jgi:putative ABC transport system permease protein
MIILHSLKTASRVFLRNKLNTFINLFGFSFGLAVSFLIFSYVKHELSYDRFHEKASNVYRAHINLKLDGKEKEVAVSSNMIGPAMKDNIPEVENYVRMFKSINSSPTLTIKNEKFLEPAFFFADSTIFDVFSIELLTGHNQKLLTQPEDVIISEKTALKYYGNTDVIGNTFKDSDNKNFIIRGVYKDFPGNSHIHPGFIASALASRIVEELRWDQANFYTYILLDEGADIGVAEKKLTAIMADKMEDWMKNAGLRYTFMPITDIHLKSKADFESESTGDLGQVYVFIAIALFILVIACINYMNLATARSLDRAKEVGLRKLMGSLKNQLVFQFLSESFILTFLSIVFAAILVYFSIPYFNNFIQNPIDFRFMAKAQNIAMIIIAWCGISLFAGIYPAFILTAFSPQQVLKGSFRVSKRGVIVRKTLVVVQLSISIVLIIGTLIIHGQMKYMSDQKLGFDKEHILIIQMQGEPPSEKLNAFKSNLQQHSNIRAISRTSAYPGNNSGGSFIKTEGMRDDENMLIWCWRVEADITEAFGFELLAGKPLDQHTEETPETEYIINETALKALGWSIDDCIGKKMEQGTGGYHQGICYGVIKDFHVNSLRFDIEPITMFQGDSYMNIFVIRLGNGDITSTLDFIKKEWNTSVADLAFDYHFLDQEFENVYAREQKTLIIISGFSIFAILIAGLGIFGLSNYEVLARTKEIGIRKVLGSSVSEIFKLVIGSFSLIVLIGFVIATPIAFFIMNDWLNGFAYRSGIDVFPFLLAGMITYLIVLLSISYQSLKAALLNPVDTLRYE